MEIAEYSALAARTIPRKVGDSACPDCGVSPDLPQMLNFALGLAGEAGEIVERVKKFYFHGHPLDEEAVIKELGDLLWYINAMADRIGAPLEEVACRNIDKLMKRYPQGFTIHDSVNREA
jgi:NTP pyrophosphatase (non-canonical NTP hydrolase)